jgi:glycerophosphoryl diester phosphodiesterase
LPPVQRTPLFDERPTVIGHRGYGQGVVAGHPENTLASYEQAVSAGLEWVETDVRRTRDDALVVHHHPTTPDGRFVVDQTAADVATQGLVFFTDLLEALPAGVGINVDVKSCTEDATRSRETTTGALTATVIAREARRRPLIVTSFDVSVLLMTRDAAPEVPLGLLAWLYFPLRKAIPAARHLGLRLVSAHWRSFEVNDVDPAPVHRDAAYSVRLAHEAGLDVVAWCPAVDWALKLAAAGVDGVIVNDVPGVQAALGRMTGQPLTID